MARRFIVNKEDITIIDKQKSIIEIVGKEVKHIQVLRYNIGDCITINEYICKITQIGKLSIRLQIIDKAKRQGEPYINVVLYVALLKTDKLDLVVQKATELGVKEVVPFVCNNVIVKLDEKTKQKRIQKLQIVADEACKQCGRTDCVKVNNILSFNEMLSQMVNYQLSVFAYENETKSIHVMLDGIRNKKYSNISAIIGPEGGFTNEEVIKLQNLNNVKSISLGKRILRAETAAINVLSIIMYEFDNELS